MSSVVVILCWLLVAASATKDDLRLALDLLEQEFNDFKLQHDKVYSSELEEQTRLQNFLHSRQQVAAHNARYAQGLVGYRLGINKYSDMQHEEFLATHNSFNETIMNKKFVPKPMVGVRSAVFIPPKHVEVPAAVDWRKKGAVTPVKDQGKCGAGWAFSAIGSLEGQHFRKTGKLLALSEQNLIDCSVMYGNSGCDGGFANRAFQYIKDNGGVDTEAAYPYNPHESWCTYKDKHYGTEDVGFAFVPKGDEKKLMLAVAVVGPISVAIDASHQSFKDYHRGVYHPSECSKTKLNHAMLLVGYGTNKKGLDYWLLKNSYGTRWGINGYMKLARNQNNHCGIASRAYYPLV